LARRSSKPHDDAAGFRWSSFLTYVSTFCTLILFGGLLMGAVVGMRPLEARAGAIKSLSPVSIRILWPAVHNPAPGAPVQTWLPRPDQEELTERAHMALAEATVGLTAEPLARIGESLAASGWFDGFPVVRRGDGSTIVVDGKWRIPGAVVRSGGRDYLVSWDAKPMPPVYQPEQSNMRVIIEPAMGPPRTKDGSRDFDTAWPGEDIAASLELLEVIATKPWSKQVAGVDASEYSSDGRLVLVTTSKTRVVWGGRPSKPAVGEVSTPQKLAHIAQLVHEFGRVDAGYALIYVNSDKLQFDISATARLP